MEDEKKERNARIEKLVRAKYDAIGSIVMPTEAWLAANPEVRKGEVVLAGQAALTLAVAGNIDAMTKSGAILEADGKKLLDRAEALGVDLHKAFHTCVSAKPKFKTEGNVVEFPAHKTVQ